MNKSKLIFIFTIPLGLVIGCNTSNDVESVIQTSKDTIDSTEILKKEIENQRVKKTTIRQDSILQSLSLVDIQSLDPSIAVDLKYTTTDNFMKMKLYHSIDRALLQKDVAERIVKCQQFLKSIHPQYSLLIYDAVRPISVQQKMWDALDSIPRSERGKFVSNPANRSMHNYGAAVDITIIDENGTPLDMGAGYDDIRKIAYPSLEHQFLASGELTETHIANRKLLRQVMTSQKFRNIPSEWWHFNACSKDVARSKYTLMHAEPE